MDPMDSRSPGGGRAGGMRTNRGELLVSHFSNWEGRAAGDGSFTDMQQTWREMGLEGKIERSGEKPAGREVWLAVKSEVTGVSSSWPE